jgi:hypothetical protein
LHGGEDGDGEIPVMKQRKGLRKQTLILNLETNIAQNKRPKVQKLVKPSKKGVSNKTTKQTKHERCSKEVGDSVGRGSIAQMHSTSQIRHQINSNTKCC